MPVESSSESEEAEEEAEEDSEEEEEEEDDSSVLELLDIEATVKPRKSKLSQPREYFCFRKKQVYINQQYRSIRLYVELTINYVI